MNYPYDNAVFAFKDEDGMVFHVTVHADHDGTDEAERGCEGCFADRLTDGRPEPLVAPFYWTVDDVDPSVMLSYCTLHVEHMLAYAKENHPELNQ